MISVPSLTISELEAEGKAKLQTGPFGTQLKASEYVAAGIPVINVRNIGFGDIRHDKLEYLNEVKAEKLHQHYLRKGDIVFGRKGAVERHVLINEDADGWIQGSDCLRARISSENVCNRYLSYYLKTQAHQDWMQALCSFGATMSSLNQDIVRRIRFPAPLIEVQKKIAAILSAYDDLIENNKRRIALLEQMAEEIYREWFVRMRFPGHESTKFEKGIPADWDIGCLGEIANILMGQSPKSEFYNETGDGLPFNQGVGTYGPRFPNKRTFCTIEGRKAQPRDILFSVRAPVGRLNVADCNMIIGRGLAAIRHKREFNSYLYYLLKVAFSSEDIIGNGAIFNSVGKNELNGFNILHPSSHLVESFNEKAKVIDAQISLLFTTQDKLTASRDSLLSRLISGKLSVEDLDIQFPPSMQENQP